MLCLDDIGGDSWDWVGPPTWERACFNSPVWGGGSSRHNFIVAKENEASPDWIIVVVGVVGGGGCGDCGADVTQTTMCLSYRCRHASNYGDSCLTADSSPAPVCKAPNTRPHLRGVARRTATNTAQDHGEQSAAHAHRDVSAHQRALPALMGSHGNNHEH